MSLKKPYWVCRQDGSVVAVVQAATHTDAQNQANSDSHVIRAVAGQRIMFTDMSGRTQTGQLHGEPILPSMVQVTLGQDIRRPQFVPTSLVSRVFTQEASA